MKTTLVLLVLCGMTSMLGAQTVALSGMLGSKANEQPAVLEKRY